MSNTNQPGGTKRIKSLEEWGDVIAKALRDPSVALALVELFDMLVVFDRGAALEIRGLKVNPHLRDRIRRSLRRSPFFERVRKGAWMLKRPALKTAGGSEAR